MLFYISFTIVRQEPYGAIVILCFSTTTLILSSTSSWSATTIVTACSKLYELDCCWGCLETNPFILESEFLHKMNCALYVSETMVTEMRYSSGYLQTYTPLFWSLNFEISVIPDIAWTSGNWTVIFSESVVYPFRHNVTETEKNNQWFDSKEVQCIKKKYMQNISFK